MSLPLSHDVAANEGPRHPDSVQLSEFSSSPESTIRDVLSGNSDLWGDELVTLQRDLTETTVQLQDIKDYRILHRRSFPSPSLASSDIWYRNLAVKGRGSPLWITGTDLNAPIQYRRSGIAIGDVGFISNFGAFHFLFNISLPADNPINRSIELPKGFIPLQPTDPMQIHEHSEFIPGGRLINKSSTQIQIDSGIEGVSLESSSDEEVILTVPQISNSQDLIDTSTFRKYIAANALNWYRLVNGYGYEARNGDLRVVVGWDESSSFFQHVSSTVSYPKEVLVLEDPTRGRMIGKILRTSSVGSRRSLRSVEMLSAALRAGERSEEGVLYKNERTFIRTLNISVSDDIWFKMAHEQGWLLLPNAAPVQIHAGGFPLPRFSTSFRPPNTLLHPANGVNALLLKMKPKANVAVTEDKEWISVLKPDDQLLPSAEEFLRRILEVYVVHEEEGVVSLKLKPEDNEEVCPESLAKECQPSGLKLLQKHIIPGALHNSAGRGDSPKYHDNTRERIIEQIMAWVTDSDRQTQVMWIHGLAGAGKTVIAHTIATMCDKAGILAASFFWSRNRSGRNKKTFLITTIVSQLIVVIPGMRKHVGDALYRDDSLLSRSLEAQLDSLIVKPFEMARSDAIDDADFLHTLRKLIILDALDECGGSESHQSVLQLILAAISQYHLPFSFLIASRPEQKIREVFDESTLGLVTVRLLLDDKYLADEDIRTFLASEFQNITQRHPSCTHLTSWPSEEDIERLVLKSSGQFVYASTVMKFISSHRHWPPDRLHRIFEILPHEKRTPFTDIDALYSHILSAAMNNIDKILDIFVVLLFFRSRHHNRLPTVSFVESFLSYWPGEVFMLLSDLHPIISVPPPSEQDRPLKFFHASMEEFLLDRSRCGKNFFLDPGNSHRKIAAWILKEMEGPSTIAKTDLGEEFASHCIKSTPTPEFLLKLTQFDMSLLSFRARDSDSQILGFLLWFYQKCCPEWKENNHPYLYMQNVDMWIHKHLTWIIETTNRPDISDAILAAVAFIDFPEFEDAHDLIFKVFCAHTCADHHPNQYTFDPQQWEIYLKYRQFLSGFLMDQRRSGALFVGPAHYIALAKCFWTFLVKETTTKPNPDTLGKLRNLKAVILTFPHILPMCGTSVELSDLLSHTKLSKRPWFRKEWPGEDDWEGLVYDLERACQVYCKTVPKRGFLDRIFSRIIPFLSSAQQ